MNRKTYRILEGYVVEEVEATALTAHLGSPVIFYIHLTDALVMAVWEHPVSAFRLFARRAKESKEWVAETYGSSAPYVLSDLAEAKLAWYAEMPVDGATFDGRGAPAIQPTPAAVEDALLLVPAIEDLFIRVPTSLA